MKQLRHLARLMRSKNAGPFQLTIDIMFESVEIYRHVIGRNVITAQVIHDLLGTDPARVEIYHYEPALTIKVTIPRNFAVGDPEDPDLFGGQQFGPLTELAVPE